MIIKIVQLSVTFLNLLLGIFVLSQNFQSRNNRLFSLMCFTAAVWTVVNYIASISLSLLWLQSSYALGALVISSGLVWTLSITEININKKRYILILFITALIAIGCFLPNFIVESYNIRYLGDINIGKAGWGLNFYIVFYLVTAFSILSTLNLAQKKTDDEARKIQLKTIYRGAFVTLIVTLISSFILPFFSIFPIEGVDNIGFLIFLIFIAYGITKHHLFSIRVFAVQLITAGLWIIIIIRLVLANNWQEIAINGALLSITIIFGIILIRSTLHEISQREDIEKLANNLKRLNSTLEAKVAEQTIEIRKSYELEKKARRELEKLNETKDQFIMITQHHLRTPVSTITWSVEAMLKNEYGQIKPELQKALEITQSAAQRLTRIVDDFLSITAIKIGTQILNISLVSMKPLLEDVISELNLDIQNINLSITYPINDSDWPLIPIDEKRMREVVLIVIENAVRYNIPNGTILISTQIKENFFELAVKNTGIGIEPDDQEKIFNNLFHRGGEARKAHALGMGVGLSVSRAIVRGHHGNIKIESEGKGMGAKVVMRLPLTR